MDINSLTIGEVKQLSTLLNSGAATTCSAPYKIGQGYFIRTVTMSYTGRITAVHPQELELSEACWIADSGRFHKALKGEWDSSAEHEPFPQSIVIGRGAIIDACPISCELPTAVK
jgi:hypothetical protein